MIAGTWSINEVLSSDVRRDDSPFITCGFPGGLFLNIEASATSASNYEWLVQNVLVGPDGGPDDRERIVSALIQSWHRTKPACVTLFIFLCMAGTQTLGRWRHSTILPPHMAAITLYRRCARVSPSATGDILTSLSKGFPSVRSLSRGRCALTAVDENARHHAWQVSGNRRSDRNRHSGSGDNWSCGCRGLRGLPAAAKEMVGGRNEIPADVDGISMASQRYAMFNRLVETLTPLWHSFPDEAVSN